MPEPHYEPGPGCGERHDVEAITGVVLEIIEVHQRRFAEVVVGKVKVSESHGPVALRARRQG
jgi:hypothetical protein